MKRVFDSPFLNKAALVLIWLLLMGGTFFYANKNYFLYHENPNLIKADGYYLYNFGSPRHYYWALPVKLHIPQELRIRSGGTERHSASN